MEFIHIDGSVFTKRTDLIKHIRSLDSSECEGLSDDFVYDEAWWLYEFEVINTKKT